ncbi:MAG: hypothetical protein AAB558_01740 [Patescibacteria group bacterium]
MKLPTQVKQFLPLGVWWIGSGVLVSLLWLVRLVLQVDLLQTPSLWFGLWATYLLPGIGLSFALQTKKVDWAERMGWIVGCGLVVMPTLLFGLTAAGLHFTPVLQVATGLGVSVVSGAVYVLRLWYAK